MIAIYPADASLRSAFFPTLNKPIQVPIRVAKSKEQKITLRLFSQPMNNAQAQLSDGEQGNGCSAKAKLAGRNNQAKLKPRPVFIRFRVRLLIKIHTTKITS